MKIFLQKENKNMKLEFNGKVIDLLKKIEINPETVVVTKDNEVIAEDTDIFDDDEIKILSVVSGG